MINRIPKDTLVALGLVVAMLVAATLLVYRPQGQAMDAHRTRLATIRQTLQADNQRAAAVPQLMQEVEALRGRYRDFDHKLPKHRELGGFLAEISSNLSRQRLRDPEIVPGNPSSQQLYNTLPIVMSCRGEYLSLASFLQEISQMRRLTRVHTLRLDHDDRDGLLNIRMQLNIYFTQS